MGLIIKIAWRNIMRHKGKSFVIGIILFMGALLMTVGNGVISGLDKGLEKNIVEGFTGHAVIVAKKQQSDNIFLEMMARAIEPLTNYPDIKQTLSKLGYVDRFLPAGKNAIMLLSNEASNPGFSMVLGVDFEQYQKVFPGAVTATEGRLLKPGEHGVMITVGARKECADFCNLLAVPEGQKLDVTKLDKELQADIGSLIEKDSLVFMGLNENNSTSDIRLGVKGIIKYKALDKILGHFPIMDIESYRECLGYISASDKAVEVSADKQQLLQAQNTDLDAMFGSDELMVGNPGQSASASPVSSATSAVETSKAVDLDKGTFNLVMVFFKDATHLDARVAQLNKDLEAAGLQARAVTWKKSFGIVASMAMLIKSALFVFVMLLFFVAIIIIVNTLSMAALERTNEIGMMRAVGARKGFISTMFFGETATLSFVFGGAGIVLGIIVVNILAALHLTSQNDMVQLFFGGDTFAPMLSIMDIVLAVVQLAVVTLIAMIYPIMVARSITPLDAIARD